MKLSIVIPSYNQSEKVISNLKEKILPFFDATGLTYSVLIEADRSSKEQIELLTRSLPELGAQVKLDKVEDRKGKGWAVQKGILHSEGDYVLFFDADLATDLSVFSLMQKDLGKYDACIASRDAKGSEYGRKQPFKRRITHWGARAIIKMMFRLKGVSDTQCGFKLFRLSVAKKMAQKQLTMGSAFDVEYLYFLQLNGYSIREYPCRWQDDPDSTLSKVAASSLRFYKDLRAIKRNKEHYLLSQEEKKC